MKITQADPEDVKALNVTRVYVGLLMWSIAAMYFVVGVPPIYALLLGYAISESFVMILLEIGARWGEQDDE